LIHLGGSPAVNTQTTALSGSEGQVISLATAAGLTSNYRGANPSATVLAEYFGRNPIQSVLNQAGVVGIRIYFGRKSDGSPALVLVGVNASGQDLTGGPLVEEGWPCPPLCDTARILTR
jgi:hypothetical protein